MPDLPAGTGVAETIAGLRRGRGLDAGQKVLIVLDQFEQWLHAHAQDMSRTDLGDALRQADGARVQVLLLIRDDFWLGISRFIEELEVRLRPFISGPVTSSARSPSADNCTRSIGTGVRSSSGEP